MIKLKHLIVLLIIITVLTGCNKAVMQGGSQTAQIPLRDLLATLPADNLTEQNLIMDAILDYGEPGILAVCDQLASADTLKSVSAHYAIDGLTQYVSKNRPAQNRLYIRALHKVLTNSTDLPVVVKVFIIKQIQYTGGSESIALLKGFLADPELVDGTVRALIAIGGPEAGNALLSELDNVAKPQKQFVIQALGELDYTPSAVQLLKYTEDKDLRDASLNALAQMGVKLAVPQVKSLAAEDAEYTDLYLRLASGLAEHKDVDGCVAICRELLDGDTPEYYKIAALDLLVELEWEKAFDDVFDMAVSDSKKARVAALRLAEGFFDEALIEKWVAQLEKSSPAVQADIIDMLGRMQEPSVVPVLQNKLKDGPTEVRLAAIKALVSIDGDDAANDLAKTLATSASEKIEFDLLKRQLQTISTDMLVPALNANLNEAYAEAKVIVIDLLDERGAAEKSALIAQLGDDPKVNASVIGSIASKMDLNDFNAIFDRYQKSIGSEQRAARNALAEYTANGKERREAVKQVQEAYKNAPVDKKADYFNLFRAIGGKSFLALIVQAMDEPELNDAAVRTLAGWNGPEALEPLAELVKTTKDTTHQVLAIRGALALLRDNSVGDIRNVEYCDGLISNAIRPAEKRMILSHLGNVRSEYVLKYVSSFLSDTTLGYDAAQAVMNIATPDKDSNTNLESKAVALAMIKGTSGEDLKAKLYANPLVEKTDNVPPEGFYALFNGVDLSGWKGLVADPPKRAKMSAAELVKEQVHADSLMNAHWRVVGDVLYFDGKGHSLCTIKDYTNFEMYVDWKIEKHGDSGIYLRGAPQVQIWDTAQWPEGSGALYNNKINESHPLAVADNPIGEWNTFRIIMKGERVTVWLNDVLVVDNVIMENYWERDIPIYPTGQIELQAHTTPLYFKNVYIKELPDEEPSFTGELFNGKDLTGWQVMSDNKDSWKVEDGVLYTEGKGGGWIATTDQFDNFKLELEFRVPEGGNSGVFVRTPLEGDGAYKGMEIQVLDDYADKYKDLKAWQYTASIYDVQAPSKRMTQKAGEWQQMVIVCDGPHVTVELNGELINDANLIDHMHRTAKHPGLTRRKGYIGLQNHSTRVEYKNIRLTELE